MFRDNRTKRRAGRADTARSSRARAAGLASAFALSAALVAGVLATGPAATPNAFADSAAADGDAAASTFTDSYTAWPGYATTAAESIAPGAVPVSAPVSGDEAWRVTLSALIEGSAAESAKGEVGGVDASASENAGAVQAVSEAAVSMLALRQAGQSTYMYVAYGTTILKLDAASGSELARTELPSRMPQESGAAFVDGVLVVPTESGQLVAYDEDLMKAWETQALPAPAGSSWAVSSDIAEHDGCVYVAFAAEGADASESSEGGDVVMAAYSSLDGSLLWTVTPGGAGSAAGNAAGEGSATPTAGSSASGATDLSLYATDDGLLFCRGDATLYLLGYEAGETLAKLEQAGPVAGRIGAVSTGAGDPSIFVVVASVEGASAEDGASSTPVSEARVVDVTDGGLGFSEPCRIDGDARNIRPVVVGGDAYLVVEASGDGDATGGSEAAGDSGATSAAGEARGSEAAGGDGTASATEETAAGGAAVAETKLVELDLSQAVEDVERVRETQAADANASEVGQGTSTGSDACFAAPAAPQVTASVAAPCATGGLFAGVYGENGREATIELQYVGSDGGLYIATFAADQGLAAATVERRADLAPQAAAGEGASEASSVASPAPVANRDGSMFCAAGGAIVALSPDAHRAVATPVGGSEGLDTVMGSGLMLPNGAGLGVGVLVLAAGFGAYYAIRNRGNRAKIDEGVVAWRQGEEATGRSKTSRSRSGRSR
ncbi:hypothetical protein [Collinsella sp. An2]|uniref:hypothetical protein n=1 Tax=Collinsella sp. An2 TaxID=1965585 RepID=UPI000B3AAAA8|nr:hypothetical protein [Collinsella sp. An2]OUP10370.1 hypothetical protein B5F33_01980 [Collinsella sp. An2]